MQVSFGIRVLLINFSFPSYDCKVPKRLPFLTIIPFHCTREPSLCLSLAVSM